ncbi:RNA polymerase sigma factor [Nocardiopsis sediminis]|uniref:RNA polymerase sigma factor n=1 Tax=Nocardiopsis sediminis TaxID=1778267 RepID=A0ABV8FSH6_9ACTN
MGDQPCGETATADLVKRALCRDGRAWDALIGRFSLRVRAVVRSYGLPWHDAEDVEQTVWCVLSDHLPRIRDPEHVGAWLAATTHNECRRQLRLRRRTAPEDPALLDSADHRSPEALHLAAERDRGVRRAIAGLDEPERTLAAIDLYSPRTRVTEVAEFTGLPLAEIPVARRRMRRRLRRILAEDHQRDDDQ